MLKYLILFAAVVLAAFSACAQKITVLDKSDLQPVANVTVYNLQNNVVRITNDKGEADISDFAENDTLFFKHLAYQVWKSAKKDLKTIQFKVLLTDNIIRLNEVVLSANKVEEQRDDLPQKIGIIKAKEIAMNNPVTAADLLQQSGMVYVQQSQLGGGSPILRGFEANRVLMVIDGVRMNNAIYRSGHLQSAITIDPSMLDRVEVVFGPGSVIYGSDAMGGTIHYYSKNPQLSFDGKKNIKVGAFSRFATAADEYTENININLGFQKIAFLTNVSYKNIGDLRMGSIRDPFYGDWGKCLYYAQRINGKDSMLKNTNYNIQKNSGYSQYDLMQKILFQPSENQCYILNLQLSNSGNISRYDRLQQTGDNGILKYAEWYYGPQTRVFASLRAEFKGKNKFYDNINLTSAWQNISEDRISRKFGKDWKQYQEETVNVLSLNADLTKKLTGKNELRYGIEAVYNSVDSKAYQKNIVSGETADNTATRYPDDGNSYTSLAAYVSHNWELSPKLILSQGLRFNYIALRSEYSDTMMHIMKFPFDKKISQDNSAFSGSAGMVYMPGSDWRFCINGSTGFRAPNVDDISKVNDSNGKDHLLVVPNPGLKPEYSYNIDVTLGKVIMKTIQLEATAYYTLLEDAIVARPFRLNGQDSVMYDGSLCQVQANTNAGEAYLYGIQGNVKIQINPLVSMETNLNYSYGRVKKEDVPLDHIPPFYGQSTYRVELNHFKSEFYIRYSAWKRLKYYSPSGEDNLESATIHGMPAWYTLNLKTAYQLNKHFNIQLAMENILDIHYRTFASGISAPGRNFIIALRGSF